MFHVSTMYLLFFFSDTLTSSSNKAHASVVLSIIEQVALCTFADKEACD